MPIFIRCYCDSSGRSPAWLGHQPPTIIKWSEYKEYLAKKYGNQYVSMQYSYAIKYIDCLENPSKILEVPTSIKGNILKALICLSKYLGIYLEFKDALKQHGIKWTTATSFDSFINIFNNSHDSLLKWYREATNILNDNEKLYLRFMLLSGIRKNEGILSFNMIISLYKQNKLDEYFNEELSALEHFKYKQFLRISKNVYISILPKELIIEIANSKPVSYNMIRKRLHKNNLKLRIKELRSYYATYLRKHGILEEEVNLLQGRIGKSIFVRHYLKENKQDFSDTILKIVKDLEQTINI
jgi:intergrase/recombinase